MLGRTRPGYGGTDAEAAIGSLFDAHHLADVLDVDNQARPDHTSAHLHQKIGSARQDPRRASRGGKGAYRFVQGVWSDVSHNRHIVQRLPRAAGITGGLSFDAFPADNREYTAERDWNSLHGLDNLAVSYAQMTPIRPCAAF